MITIRKMIARFMMIGSGDGTPSSDKNFVFLDSNNVTFLDGNNWEFLNA